LDLYLAIDRVLRRHTRLFGGRAVRGESMPQFDELVGEVARALPTWVQPRVKREQIAQRLQRHLATGRWPFDVLVSPNA
jgi:hypothetical protein